MKFRRGPEPAAPIETDLRVEVTHDPEPLGLVIAEGFEVTHELGLQVASVATAPGWHCFIAWAGDEPAAAGTVFVDGASAWFGIGATRPAFRRRGGQSALLATRIDRAVALGATILTTETGERLANRPSNSYRNILRAGFREQYVRANWQSPARGPERVSQS